MSDKKDIQEKASPSIMSMMDSPVFKKELSHVVRDIDKYIVSARTYISLAKNSDKIMECDPRSIARCIITAANFGLSLDGKGHAYLIPFKKTCQFMPGYKGYLYLIQRNGIVKNITTDVVYGDDIFKATRGTDPKIHHEICLDGNRDDKSIKAVYSVLYYKSGAIDFEIMDRSQIDKIRDQVTEKNGNESSIWKYHYGEMARKTVVRRFAKRLQLPEVSDLMELDDLYSQGNIVNIENGRISAEKNTELIESAKEVDEEKNQEMVAFLHEAIIAEKMPENALKQYSMGMFGTRDYVSLPTEDLKEVHDQLIKDYKLG